MAEIKGYIYEEIKNLAHRKKTDAQVKVEKKYAKELEAVRRDAEKEIAPKVLKAAKIQVDLESYGGMKIEVKIPDEIRKSLVEKYDSLKAGVGEKIDSEQQAIEEKYRDWLCEFAKNANEGIVIDLPKF